MSATVTSNTPNAFLERLGIRICKGQPLHQYRISQIQYDEMLKSLRAAAQTDNLHRLSAAFVLWAAERFRRDFAGGTPSWDFYAEPLRTKCHDNVFRETTMRGMQRMGRGVVEGENARYYLKTIAAEGGLPQALIADPDGRYRHLVVRLMEDILRVGTSAPYEIINQHAQHRLDGFPLGYRQPEFRATLIAFASELLALRGQVPTSIPAAARTSWLDANFPDWMEKLPLRLDDDGARSLVDEALTVEMQVSSVQLISRVLVRIGDRWTERLAVARASEIPQWLLPQVDPSLRRLRLLPDPMLAQAVPNLIISAERNDDSQIWRLSRDSGGRTAESNLPLSHPVVFQIIGDGVDLGHMTPNGGAPLAPDETATLWVSDDDGAANSDAETLRLRKLGSTSVRTRKPLVWLLTGHDDMPTCDGLTMDADGASASGRLWRISGSGVVHCDGWTLHVKTASDDENADRLVAQGRSVAGLRDKDGSEIFSGMPQFMVQQATGAGRILRPDDLAWRRHAQSRWTPDLPTSETTGGHAIGTYQIGWRPDQSEVRAIERVCVLPETARLSLRRHAEGGLALQTTGLASGTIITFHDTGLNAVPPVTAIVPETGAITLRQFPDDAGVGKIAIDLMLPSVQTKPFRCLMKVPATRAWFVGENDLVLRDDLEIEVDQLRDWRMVLPANVSADLRLRLMSADGEALPNVLRRISHETPLVRFGPLIRAMMAIGGSDASVRLRLIVGGEESCRLTVRPFLRDARWMNGDCLLAEGDSQGGEELELLCLNLLAPNLSTDLVAASGTPLSDRLPRDPGPWLILPRDMEGAMRPARPLSLPRHEIAIDSPRFSEGFASAGQLPSRKQRIAAFVAPLRRLLTPAGQGDLALLLQQMDEMALAGNLSCLDIIAALAETPEVLALMLLQAAPDRIIDRLDLERSSPFAWISLPLSAWAAAAKSERTRLRLALESAGLPGDEPAHFAALALVAKIRMIRDHRPDLSGVLLLMADRMNLFRTFLKEFGHVPDGLSAPEAVLVREGRMALSRHGDTTQSFPMRSKYAPAAFDTFNPAIRDLTDAPLVIAEFVLGMRPYPPDRRQAIALLHYEEYDPIYIEAALPAAIALLSQRSEL